MGKRHTLVPHVRCGADRGAALTALCQDGDTIGRDVFAGYIDAMEWSTLANMPDRVEDNDDRCLDGVDGLVYPRATLRTLRANVQTFLDSLTFDELSTLADATPHPAERSRWEQVGHDLWLTSAGAGVGFWDGDYDTADHLIPGIVDLACEYATKLETEPYVGDNHRIYVSR